MDSQEENEKVYQEPNPYQEVNVYPNIKVYKTICKAQIKILEIKLFEGITIMVRLLDENDVIVESRILIMDKSNGYDQWANDDSYVLKWVSNQLNKL
jgi:uncharacterized protein YkvS